MLLRGLAYQLFILVAQYMYPILFHQKLESFFWIQGTRNMVAEIEDTINLSRFNISNNFFKG